MMSSAYISTDPWPSRVMPDRGSYTYIQQQKKLLPSHQLPDPVPSSQEELDLTTGEPALPARDTPASGMVRTQLLPVA